MLLTRQLSPVVVLFAFMTTVGYVNSFVSKKVVGSLPEVRVGFKDTSTGNTKPSSSSLAAVPSPVVWSAVGTVLGGTTGVPVVAKAINSWYKKIDLPPWTPPDRIFAPTWTFLYAAMGVAAGRVYQRGGATFPIILCACHYLLNLCWAPVFFGRKRLRLGLFINFVLLATLGIIIPTFYQIDALSGKLLLPYLAWLIFATALNASICKRNPTKDGYNNAKFQSDLAQLQDDAADYAGV